MIRILQVLAVVLAQWSIGAMLVAAILPSRVVQQPFYTVTSLFGALTAATTLLLARSTMPESWETARWIGISIMGALSAFVAFRTDRRDIGRFLLLGSGIGALLFGLLPLTDDILRARDFVTRVPYIFAASSLVGTMVLGAASIAAFYSLWAWFMGGPMKQDLARLIKLTLGALAARTLLLLGMLVGLSHLDPRFTADFFPTLWAEDVVIFGLRVATGLVLPFWLCAMALRDVRAQEETCGMKWLLMLTGSVFIGEMLAGLLLI